jgi:hypothetical protein
MSRTCPSCSNRCNGMLSGAPTPRTLNLKKYDPSMAGHFQKSARAAQTGLILAACLPFGPIFTSKLTF